MNKFSRCRSRIAALFLIVSGLLIIIPAWAAGPYTVVDLGGVGLTTGTVRGINNTGLIVGQTQFAPSTDYYAYVLNSGVLTNLGGLGGTSGVKSEALSINQNGQMVGYAYLPSGAYHATLWSNGAITDLGTLGGLNSSALGINDSGQVTGWAWSGSGAGSQAAVVWSNGTMSAPSPLPGLPGQVSSSGNAINNLGQVVGSWTYVVGFTGYTHAFLWNPGSQSLSDIGAAFTGQVNDTNQAVAINDLGHIVINRRYGAPDMAPCCEVSYLMVNGASTAIGSMWTAAGINNSDQVVGAKAADGFNPRAELWDNGVDIDLNTLIDQTGWILDTAVAINDNGQIIGYGRFGGVSRLFLMTPIPADNTDLSVSITGSSKGVIAGQDVTYTVVVTNRGMATATGVTLAGLPGCILSNNTIAMGGSATCTATASSNSIGTITQTVSVSGNETDPNSANNTATISTNVTPPADLAITVSAPAQVYGDYVTYQVTVTNNGPNSATGIVLSGLPPVNYAGDHQCTLSSTTLASGASATCSKSYYYPLATVVASIVSVDANEGDPDRSNNSVSVSTTMIPTADLSVVISATPNPVQVGGLVTYLVTVKSANNNATGITLSGLPGCTLPSTTITNWYDTLTCTVSVVASTIGALTQTVSVSGDKFDPNTVNNTATVTTTVSPVTYTLSLSAAGTGTGTVAGAGTYNSGASVLVTATANTGSTFTGWSGPDGVECASGIVTMTANKSCIATFTLNTYTLSLSTAGNGSGAVSGAGTYNYNTSATVTATANAGSTFAGWSGPDGAACTTGSVSMTANRSCTATFTLNTYTLSLSTAGTGSGAVSGAGTYNYNTSATVAATANTGSTFAGWSGPDGAACTTGSVLMTANKSCTATFTLNTAADLVPTALSASTSGSSLVIKDSVKNQGNAAAGAFTISYYLSTDATYGAGDAYVCSRSVSSLAAGASNPATATGTATTTCALPAVTAGTYYVLVVDDSGNVIAESNESNNVRATSAGVNVGPDLIPTAVSASKSGPKVPVSDTVKNQGTANVSSAFTVSYYLSTDSSYQAGTDIALASSSNGSGMCTRNITSLKAGSSNSGGATCYKPTAAKNGVNYYVLAVDDAGNVIAESNEANNSKATGSTIRW